MSEHRQLALIGDGFAIAVGEALNLILLIPSLTSMNTEQADSRQLILVTGPTRSGKSEWAEDLAKRSAQSVIYVATARRDETDSEWQARIEKHRQRRLPSWTTLEVPDVLAATIQSAPADTCLLIDSLGTWVANFLDDDEASWSLTVQELMDKLKNSTCSVVFVAEETGWGVIPAYPLGRTFRDRLGDLVRQIGAIANPVYLVTGGHVLNLSTLGSPLCLQ